jgi:predicted aspartyl protease
MDMKLLSRLAILTTALVFSAGHVPDAAYASSSEVHFDSGKSARSIPFERHNNQIYLRATVNGSQPLWFILDTGARTLISRSAARSLGLKLKERGEVQSTGESVTFKIATTENVSFKLPGVVLNVQQAGVISLDEVQKCVNHPADGIIGLELFNRSVVEIDYQSGLINIFEAKSYKYSGKGEPLPLEIMDNGLVTVRADITPPGRASITGKFLIDTGLAGSLLLNSPFVERNKLLDDGRGEKFINCGFGESRAVKDKIAALRLGGFKFDNVTTIFSQASSGVNAADDVNGLIGGDILSQYKVIFDYLRKRMILEGVSRS